MGWWGLRRAGGPREHTGSSTEYWGDGRGAGDSSVSRWPWLLHENGLRCRVGFCSHPAEGKRAPGWWRR